MKEEKPGRYELTEQDKALLDSLIVAWRSHSKAEIEKAAASFAHQEWGDQRPENDCFPTLPEWITDDVLRTAGKETYDLPENGFVMLVPAKQHQAHDPVSPFARNFITGNADKDMWLNVRIENGAITEAPELKADTGIPDNIQPGTSASYN